MTRVIAAIDNSAAAAPVLSAAAEVARIFEAELEAVHVGDATESNGARAAAKSAGVRLRVVRGPTVQGILKLAQKRDVAAVVVGARALPSGRRPAGHVSTKVATSLAKPVVVVPPDCAYPVQLRQVLIPLERDMLTAAALRQTIEAFSRAAASIVLLHVFEEHDLPLMTEQPQHEMEAWISEFLRRYCHGIDVQHVELRAGLPGEHVLSVADEIGAGAIVLGWSRRLVPGRAALVRTALEHSRVPLILVPVERIAENR